MSLLIELSTIMLILSVVKKMIHVDMMRLRSQVSLHKSQQGVQVILNYFHAGLNISILKQVHNT